MRVSLGALFPILLLITPILVLAQTSGGFPTATIWLSKESAVAGETVTIYAPVRNSSDGKLIGTTAFSVDGKKVGTAEFELEKGHSAIQSVSWTAVIGKHSISATLENVTDGQKAVALSDTQTDSIDIIVAAPPPSPIADALGAASAMTNQVIASSSPIAKRITNSVMQFAEPLRQSGKEYFEDKIARSDTGTITGFTGPEGIELGTSTEHRPDVSGFASLWKTLVNGFNKAGLTIFSSAAYFYPFFAILFFLLLYMAIKWAQRRPYGGN